ncbi:MAG: hypothetical protein KC441_14875 [Anaerolineales bacterium]|nr:hypothetical protein [Anaerolineales bacterium]
MPPATPEPQGQPWIEIHDEEVTASALQEAIETRLQARPSQWSSEHLTFPTFGYAAPLPEPPPGVHQFTTLHHHLRQLNQMPPPDTTPLLVESPALRVPILGRLWRQIRGQAHQLVLFYVNRLAARETAVTNHTVSALNELTRLAQQQQAEIDQLRAELRRWQPPTDDES